MAALTNQVTLGRLLKLLATDGIDHRNTCRVYVLGAGGASKTLLHSFPQTFDTITKNVSRRRMTKLFTPSHWQ